VSTAGAAPGVMSDNPSRGTVATMRHFVDCMKSSFSSPQDAFGAFDLNADGCSEREEFTAAAALLAEPLSTYEASYVFTGFDFDRDDRVCMQEFFSGLRQGHFPEDMRGAMTVSMFKERMGRGTTPQFAFASLDTSGDEKVDFTELLEGRNAFRPPLSQEEVRSAFVGFDSDASNKIELKEFLNAISLGHFVTSSDARHAAKPTLTAEGFRQRLGGTSPQSAFLALDRNDDGFVSFNEFMGTRGAFVPPFTDMEAQRAFEGLDGDTDMRVSFPEFHDVLSKRRFYHKPKDAQ